MDTPADILEIINKGGVAFYGLIFVSLYITTIIFYKIFQFSILKNFNTTWLERASHKSELLKIADELKHSNINNIPVGKIVLATINSWLVKKHSFVQLEEEVKIIRHLTIKRLELFIAGLNLSIKIAPLLGVVATLVGLSKIFASLEQNLDQINLAYTLSGIWMVLISSIAGIVIAIIAIVARHIFITKIEAIKYQMDEVHLKLISIITSITEKDKEREKKSIHNRINPSR